MPVAVSIALDYYTSQSYILNICKGDMSSSVRDFKKDLTSPSDMSSVTMILSNAPKKATIFGCCNSLPGQSTPYLMAETSFKTSFKSIVFWRIFTAMYDALSQVPATGTDPEGCFKMPLKTCPI